MPYMKRGCELVPLMIAVGLTVGCSPVGSAIRRVADAMDPQAATFTLVPTVTVKNSPTPGTIRVSSNENPNQPNITSPRPVDTSRAKVNTDINNKSSATVVLPEIVFTDDSPYVLSDRGSQPGKPKVEVNTSDLIPLGIFGLTLVFFAQCFRRRFDND